MTYEKRQYFNEPRLLNDQSDQTFASEDSNFAFFGEIEKVSIPQRRKTPKNIEASLFDAIPATSKLNPE